MIVVTEAWIFNGPIQHLLAIVFVAMFIGISYLFVKKVQDLEIQLVVLKEKNSVLKTESENLKRKVELLEISFTSSLLTDLKRTKLRTLSKVR